MLQTNPVKRITLNEIKRHRWFLQDLPSYLQDLSRASFRNDNQVDKDVVRHLMNVSEIISDLIRASSLDRPTNKKIIR